MKSKGMRIAGGVLALVASVGGTIAGFCTAAFGAVDKASTDYAIANPSGMNGQEYMNTLQHAGRGQTIANHGFMGILVSFLILILAIVVLCSKSQKPAWLLLVCSVVGMFLGGPIVAFFMVLAVLGAIFALVGGKKVPTVPIP